jgi:hypothetical protein
MSGRFVAALLLAAAAQAGAAPAPLPKEVQAFVDKRESCDHWRGEDGYDAERQKDIDWSLCQACTGTDAELARLQRKHRGNARVAAALAGFEPRIEPADKADRARFCKTTRKPDWE